MAHPRRILRLQQLILEIVSETIQREARDPRIGMVSVTRVELSQDMTHAIVYWSSLGGQARSRTVAAGLEQFRPVVQGRLAKALQTRVTPHLELRFDPGLERAQRLDDIFHRLHEERGPSDAETTEAGGADDAGVPADTPPDTGPGR